MRQSQAALTVGSFLYRGVLYFLAMGGKVFSPSARAHCDIRSNPRVSTLTIFMVPPY